MGLGGSGVAVTCQTWKLTPNNSQVWCNLFLCVKAITIKFMLLNLKAEKLHYVFSFFHVEWKIKLQTRSNMKHPKSHNFYTTQQPDFTYQQAHRTVWFSSCEVGWVSRQGSSPAGVGARGDMTGSVSPARGGGRGTRTRSGVDAHSRQPAERARGLGQSWSFVDKCTSQYNGNLDRYFGS